MSWNYFSLLKELSHRGEGEANYLLALCTVGDERREYLTLASNTGHFRAKIQLAALHVEESDLDWAVRLLRDVIHSTSGMTYETCNEIVSLLQIIAPEDMHELFAMILVRNPTLDLPRVEIAVSQWQMKDFAGAFENFSKCDRSNPKVAFYLGKAFSKGRGTDPNFCDARNYFLSVVEHFPRAYYKLAKLFIEASKGKDPCLNDSAMTFLLLAKEAGIRIANIKLGQLMESRDPDEACILYEEAYRGVSKSRDLERIGHLYGDLIIGQNLELTSIRVETLTAILHKSCDLEFKGKLVIGILYPYISQSPTTGKRSSLLGMCISILEECERFGWFPNNLEIRYRLVRLYCKCFPSEWLKALNYLKKLVEGGCVSARYAYAKRLGENKRDDALLFLTDLEQGEDEQFLLAKLLGDEDCIQTLAGAGCEKALKYIRKRGGYGACLFPFLHEES
eukprot:TRINITY_DN10670_c0_g1_i1.p1 TRINITY_DN10670_c0_g1~~TRINITY_DN10670_c0_g1_i1.p1  ORF type:complete len:450 (+),score=59.31 TRINITY_DN10670_c0_g1_i1:385-1734(+)